MTRMQKRSLARTRRPSLRASAARGFARYRTLFRHPNIRLLLAAALGSEIGDWFNTVALIELSYQLGGGAVSVGIMLALRTVPRLLLQAPAGSLVDRWPGRGLIIVSHVLMGLIATAFVLLIPIPSLWLLYALVIALESVGTISWPALRIQLVRETPPTEFAAINGLVSIGLTGAQFLGPLLGGLLLIWFGAGPVFVINGLTFLAVAIAASRLRPSPTGPDESVSTAPASGPIDGASAGYRTLLGQHALLGFAVVALAVTITVRAAISLFVVRADHLGLGEAGPGYFYAAVALGAIAGGVVAGTGSHSDRTALMVAGGAMLVSALALGGFGAAPGAVTTLAALVLAGGATNIYEVAGMTFFQHNLPPSLYGRFMAIFMLALGIGGVIGAIGGPLIQTRLSVATSLWLLALPGSLLALAFLYHLRGGRQDGAGR